MQIKYMSVYIYIIYKKIDDYNIHKTFTIYKGFSVRLH